MRNMTSSRFCSVCKEGMYLELLAKVSLIDSVETVRLANGSHKVTVNLLPLAHLRKAGTHIPGEKYVISWKRDGVVQHDLNDMQEIEMDDSRVGGKWQVSVEFISPEIRKSNGLTTSSTPIRFK
jgi:hypothetical protein